MWLEKSKPPQSSWCRAHVRVISLFALVPPVGEELSRFALFLTFHIIPSLCLGLMFLCLEVLRRSLLFLESFVLEVHSSSPITFPNPFPCAPRTKVKRKLKQKAENKTYKRMPPRTPFFTSSNWAHTSSLALISNLGIKAETLASWLLVKNLAHFVIPFSAQR